MAQQHLDRKHLRTTKSVYRWAYPDGLYRTLNDIGQEWGVSRERVRQILDKWDVKRPERPNRRTD